MATLICYDGSPSAQHALEVAALSLGGTPAVLLHVYSVPEQVAPESFGIAEARRPVSLDGALELTRRRAEDVLEHGEALADRLRLAVGRRSEACRSTVWQTVLDVADAMSVEVIVCGTHGTTAAVDAPLGSVSAGIVRHARRPVLVVPTPAQSATTAGLASDHGA